MYDFDKIIPRKNTNSTKYDKLEKVFGRKDLIPLWVADMDFQSAPEIIEGFIQRSKYGIFGYTFASDDYYKAIINWQKEKNEWIIYEQEISFTPGVVSGISFVIDIFTKIGDKVIIQPPVYHPFRLTTLAHKRKIVNNPLLFDGKQYKMDFDNLREIVKNEDCKLLILSNPHNPGGRVWTRNELYELSEICYEARILVISDEIHSDLTLFGNKFIPFASVSRKAEQNSITFNAPTKSFNLAGIISAYSIIKNQEIRSKYNYYMQINNLEEAPIFSYLGLQLAYEKASEWLKELKKYLEKNVDFVDDYLKSYIPKIKIIRPESTFLIWLDCRKLNLPQKELVSLFINKAHLALNDGEMFGKQGIGFMRLNIGCPKVTLEKALNQLREAIGN